LLFQREGFVVNVVRLSARCAPAIIFACALALHAVLPAVAGASPGSEIDGRVVDAQTGLPLAGASISVTSATAPVHSPDATTDESGNFRLAGLPPGTYALRIARPGYQPTDADTITLGSTPASVGLALQSAPSGERAATIGRTSTRQSGALQKASTIYRSVDVETLAQSGTYRAGDALRGLPGINNGITGDTAALGDDLQLAFRGIGTLESLTTLDGHPIAYGVPGGYNYQLSPIAGLRNSNVVYGSSSNLAGYS
jgi:hypothetical protein